MWRSVFYITVFSFCSYFVAAQSIVAPTLAQSGGFFETGMVKGGATLGEVAVETYTLGSNQVLTGFQFILFNGSNAGCLVVTSILPDGEGSLREAIACALEGDVITFDENLPGSFVYLDQPTVICNKQLTFLSVNPMSLRNFNPGNTGNLVLITKPLTLQGIGLKGTSPDAMILEIGAGGNIELEEGEIESADVQIN